MLEIEISGYMPGAIGRITKLHADYYSKFSGFGLYFESKIASELAEFLNRFNEEIDGFWIAKMDDKIVGSIAVDGIKSDSEGAHLRWFIVDPNYQGRGIGTKLLQEAIGFCKRSNSRRIYLWTFEGLDAARHLYEKNGFFLLEEREGNQWGVIVNEQLFEILL